MDIGGDMLAIQTRIGAFSALGLAPVFLLTLHGCYKDSAKTFDGTEDAAHDPVTDPLPDLADGSDVPDLPDIPDLPDMDAEEDIPPQGAITFVVRNVGAETRYVYWSLGEEALIAGQRTTGGAWSDIDYWTPGCMFDCAETGTGEECCIMCEAPPPRVREILPGREIRVTWDGEHVFEVDEDYCTCHCYWVRPPVPMAYMATVCVYADFSCDMPPCLPDDEGVYENSYVAGSASCFDAQFDIPYPLAEVVIEVE